MTKPFYIIVAADRNNGIGCAGTLPWDLKEDLKFFQKTTLKTIDQSKKNAVIMGRTTWESIPIKHRPLKNRENIVLTSNSQYAAPGARVYSSLNDALWDIDQNHEIENAFIIGGAKLYRETINHPDLRGVYITRIHGTFNCDAHFPAIPAALAKRTILGCGREQGMDFDFLLYCRI